MGHIGKWCSPERQSLLPLIVEFLTLLAKRLAAVALPQVLGLDVVSRIAVGVVVVNVFFD